MLETRGRCTIHKHMQASVKKRPHRTEQSCTHFELILTHLTSFKSPSHKSYKQKFLFNLIYTDWFNDKKQMVKRH